MSALLCDNTYMFGYDWQGSFQAQFAQACNCSVTVNPTTCDPNCLVYYLNMLNSRCPAYVDTVATPPVDTVFIEVPSCGTDTFFNDFQNMVSSVEMNVFLVGVMAGILAVRAVIKVIKSAVR